MKTGIELIAHERQEQIEKHRRTIESDVTNNGYKQLSEAAKLLLNDPRHLSSDHIDEEVVPFNWDVDVFRYMMDKPYMERLIIAGALIAAELDRINNAAVQ